MDVIDDCTKTAPKQVIKSQQDSLKLNEHHF